VRKILSFKLKICLLVIHLLATRFSTNKGGEIPETWEFYRADINKLLIINNQHSIFNAQVYPLINGLSPYYRTVSLEH
jgi:hypothetical protein